MRVVDLLKMLAEIMGLPEAVKFRDEDYAGHYVRTPYAYQPKLGRNIRRDFTSILARDCCS